MTSTSYGQELPDQFSVISSALSAHIGLVHDTSTFFSERAMLERDYANKLRALTHKYRTQRDKRVMECTVGPDPSKQWSPEVVNRSSFQFYVTSVIAASESVSADHTALAGQLEKVAADTEKGERRAEDMRKKHNAFYQKVIADREKVYSERAKAKSKYDEHCKEVEQQRHKREKAESTGTNSDRARKGYDASEQEMLNAKNIYLVSIAAQNRAKERFFGTDMPRLQDDLQVLWDLVDRQLVGHVKRISAQLAEHSEKISSKQRRTEADAAKVVVDADQVVYTEYNVRRFDMPADVTFEPCVGFFDTPDMSVEDASKVPLQNLIIRKEKKISEVEPIVASKIKEIEGLERLRAAYTDNPSLGDPEEITDNLLESTRNVIVLEAELSILEAEIATISEAFGGDLGEASPHQFKAHNFTIPATCNFCESKIFGMSRQGFVCKPCGFTCHAKCEPKVPADCRASPAQRLKASTGDASSRRQSMTSLSRSSTSRRTSMAAGATTPSERSSSEAAPARSNGRTIPPATGARRAGPPPVQRGTKPSATSSQHPSATAMYDYEATSAQELSISDGDHLTIIEEDNDSSGWVKARDEHGAEGLVPASYLTITAPPAASASRPSAGRRAPPPRPAAGGAGSVQGVGRFVRALYDYAAQEDNELTLSEGEEVELTSTGYDFGAGWCEGVKAGKVGVFPANYVENI